MNKLFGNKKLVVVGLVVVLLLALTAVYMMMPGMLPQIPLNIQVGTGTGPAAPAEAKEPHQPEIDEEALKSALAEKTFLSGQGVMYEVAARVINLADPSSRRYLRIAMYLEFVPKDPAFYSLQGEERMKVQEEFIAREVSPMNPVIEDTVTSILSSKTAGDIFTVGGKNKLKEEIKTTLSSLILGVRVANVYFIEFLIQ